MLDNAALKISKELNIPVDIVKKVYKYYWKFIKEKIENLPLKENLFGEDFNKLKTNFNIPSIGKLYLSYDRYRKVKDKFYYNKVKKDGKTYKSNSNI